MFDFTTDTEQERNIPSTRIGIKMMEVSRFAPTEANHFGHYYNAVRTMIESEGAVSLKLCENNKRPSGLILGVLLVNLLTLSANVAAVIYYALM